MSNFKDFVAPAGLAEARAELLRLGADAHVVAGGTSLLFMTLKEPKVAVDLSRAGLSYIRERGDGFAVGAMTSIAEIRACRVPGWVLHEVAGRFVTQQMRNQSTLGGNIARVFAWADFPVALLALGASVAIQGEAERVLFADEFFKGQPARLFQGGDLLAEVRVPSLKPGQGFGYHKQTRVSADFSQGTAAALLQIEDGVIESARVALGASVPLPVRLPEVESALVGKAATGETCRAAAAGLSERTWRSVAGFKPDYIRHIAEVAIADALSTALARALGR